MRMSTLLLWVTSIQLMLVTALVMLVSMMHLNQIDLEEAEHRRMHSFLVADELRQSSDDLTRFARTYVVTGDARF